MTFTCLEDTPVGPVYVAAENGTVTRIGFAARPREPHARDDAGLAFARAALERYFAREEPEPAAAVPYRLQGTPFQKAVWAALIEIPFGETVSYGELARRIGQPGASRAVGMANHQNPLPILVPCHRVIGASGDLVGFGGGLAIKRKLLEFEGAFAQLTLPL